MTGRGSIGVVAAVALTAALGGCASLQDVPKISRLDGQNTKATTAAFGRAAGIDIGRRQYRRAGARTVMTVPTSIATVVGPGANIFENVAISLGVDPGAGSAESICPSAGPISHVEEFGGTSTFDRTLIANLQRSTVRISLQPREQLARSVRDDLGIANIDLGVFTGYEDWNRGFCTGTLITRNIVLTAGHCVSPRYWQQEKGFLVPEISEQDGESRPIRGKEFARLMQVEFNYQNRFLADSNSFQPATYRDDRLALRVVELISADYRDPDSVEAVDYALLRIEADEPAARERTEAVALGLGRLQLTPLAANRPIAIIQHPSGFEKKVAAGSLQTMRRWRLFYKVSTEGGSSGAGIVTNQGRLAGVHTRGGCASAADGFANKGMSLHRIKDVFTALRGP